MIMIEKQTWVEAERRELRASETPVIAELITFLLEK